MIGLVAGGEERGGGRSIIAEHYERHENRCGVPSQVVELDHPLAPSFKRRKFQINKTIIIR